MPLALDITFRPVTEEEPIPREELLNKVKTAVEGAPSEQRTFLGWLVDTRRMTVSLPNGKTQ